MFQCSSQLLKRSLHPYCHRRSTLYGTIRLDEKKTGKICPEIHEADTRRRCRCVNYVCHIKLTIYVWAEGERRKKKSDFGSRILFRNENPFGKRKWKAKKGYSQWSNDQRGLRSTPHWLHNRLSLSFQVSSKQSENKDRKQRNYILYYLKKREKKNLISIFKQSQIKNPFGFYYLLLFHSIE